MLSRHADDVTGLVLVAAGLICGLGIYLRSGGPAGRGIAEAASTGLGWLRHALPLALVAGGGALILARESAPAAAGRPTADPTGDDDVDRPSALAHAAVGAILLTLAAAGLLDLAGGQPAFGDPAADLRSSGGWLGVAVGTPLHATLGTGGAAAVLVVLAVAGLVVLTRTPLRDAADRTLAGARPLVARINRRLAVLFRLPYDDADGAPPVAEVIDPAFMPDDDTLVESSTGPDAPPEPTPVERTRGRRKPRFVVPEADEAPAEQLEIKLGPAAKASPWKLPPVTLLDRSGSQQVDRREIEETGRTLGKALADHGVETRLVGMVVGPTVTRYELELGPGIKVNRLTSLHKDIAYAMATPDVRILAPIPGKQAIGIEVPNARRQIVALGDILVSEEARRAKHPLEVAVGRDINGRSVMINLAAMPHVLIAGATGAGKSSCLNSLITSILMRSTPDQVRMILVDPKRVEMGQYDRLPHLLTNVVTNPKRAANALAWAVKEMERRYDLLAEVGFRDITGYNAAVDRGDLEPEGTALPLPDLGDAVDDDDTDQDVAGADRTDPDLDPFAAPDDGAGTARLPTGPRQFPRLPFVMVVIDELADLMMVAAPRRRGVDRPPGPDGPGGRHPPGHRDPAAVGQRDHRPDQGQRARPHRVRRLVGHRQPGHPRPGRGRAAGRQGRHADPRQRLVGRPPHPGRVGHRGRGPQGRRGVEAPGARGHLRRGRPGHRRRPRRRSRGRRWRR